jgi:Zn-dependent M28 family amino/carboxypeptidase
VLTAEKHRPNIWLVWFDGEESIPLDWDENMSLYGSRHMADEMFSDPKLTGRLRVMVLMDLIGSRNFKIDRDYVSHPALSDLFGEVAAEMGEAGRMFRFKSSMTDDHVPFQLKGVKVIDLIDFRHRTPNDRRQHGDRDATAEGEFEQWWHTDRDTVENMDPNALAFTGNLVHRAIPRIVEKYYQ